MPRARGAPPRSILRVAAAGFACLAVLAVAFTAWVLWPRSSPHPHGDVAVVLAGGYDDRFDRARVLLDDGAVAAAWLSFPTPDAAGLAVRGCGERPDITCTGPVGSVDTIGELRALQPAADAAGWDSAVLITHRAHVARARYLMRRCTDLTVMVDTAEGTNPWILPRHVLWEAGGWARIGMRLLSGKPLCG